MTYKYTELNSTLRLFTFILDTLKSTPTVALDSSSSKNFSSEKRCIKLLFHTLELPIKSSSTFTVASEYFVLIFDFELGIQYNTAACVVSVEVV